MNFTLIGSMNRLRRTSSDSPSMPANLALSFSVVIIILGEGMPANAVFIRSMSFFVNWWWSGKANCVMFFEYSRRS